MEITQIIFSQNWIISSVFIFLTIISLLSWYLIFYKIIFFKKELKSIENPQKSQTIAAFAINESFAIIEKYGANNQEISFKKIAIILEKSKIKLSFGQNFLASIANLAPFIGLFGTVLGVYFALIEIASQGSANIAIVAKPIGEALIATAMGLWCAIPASFAFNFFSKKSSDLVAKVKIIIEEKSIQSQEK